MKGRGADLVDAGIVAVAVESHDEAVEASLHDFNYMTSNQSNQPGHVNIGYEYLSYTCYHSKPESVSNSIKC